jgi:hypothetical protein
LGELYVYDTSLRIGAYMGIWPQKVYLHAGTRKGAKALGFPSTARSIDPLAMPIEMSQLEPREMEDFLCIYKAHLAKLNE